MQALSLSRSVLVLAAFAAAVAASAATKTYTFSTTSIQPDDSQTKTLPRFDPTLGTLTSVEFDFDGMVSSLVEAYNPATTGTQSVSVDLNLGLSLQNLDFATSVLGVAYDPAAVSESINHLESKNFNYGKTGVSAANGVAVTNPVALLAVTGLSPISFELTGFDLSTTKFVGANGDALYSSLMQANGKVIYTYQPVPEPSSVAALGLGALGLLRRRARKSAR